SGRLPARDRHRRPVPRPLRTRRRRVAPDRAGDPLRPHRGPQPAPHHRPVSGSLSVLRVTDEARVRLLTLERPEAPNALDTEHYHALADALDDAADRSDLAVVTITGSHGAFCAGQDLAEMGRLADPDQGAERGAHGFSRFV